MNDAITIKWEKGIPYIHPTHPSVKSWRFEENRKEEAMLCNAMAVLAEKNGVNINTLSHLFPAVLRMMSSDSLRAK